MSSRIQEIIRFVTSGAVVAVLSIVVLAVLTEFFGVWYLLSSSVAFVVGLITNFYLQKNWTFGDTGKESVRKWGLYLASAVLNLVLNTIIMYFLVDFLHMWYIVAQALVMLCLATFNYTVYRKIIFTSRSAVQQDSTQQ